MDYTFQGIHNSFNSCLTQFEQRKFSPDVIRNGIGSFTIENTTYEGEWKDNKKNGNSAITYNLQ